MIGDKKSAEEFDWNVWGFPTSVQILEKQLTAWSHTQASLRYSSVIVRKLQRSSTSETYYSFAV